MLFVQGGIVNARLHQGGGNAVGGGGGVAVLEAPGIGGYGHVEGQGDFCRNGAPLPHDVINELSAGGTAWVHTALLTKALVGGVVVDGQINAPFQPGLPLLGKEAPGRQVHRDHKGGLHLRRGQIGFQIGGKEA
jgi:hypothetical protein